MAARRLLIDWGCIALCGSLIALLLALTSFSRRVDNLLYDRLLSWRAPSPSPQIIIIAIDNRSLAAIGKWPWPRTVHAKMLNQLAQYQTRAIAYDVLFTEPSPYDPQLARALKSSAPAYLPLLFDAAHDEANTIAPVPPVPMLQAAAAAVGHVNVHFDTDGLVRRADLSFSTQQRRWPHLMTLLAGQDSPPKSGWSPLPILFQAHAGAFRTASFIDVLNGEVPAPFFRNKFVLVGASGDGLGDQFPAPLVGGGLISGVDMQANLLNTLLSNRQIMLVTRGWVALASLLPLWVLLIGFWRWRPTKTFIVAALLIIGTLIISAGLFVNAGWWIPPSPALFALLFAYPAWAWRRLAALSARMATDIRQFQEKNVPLAQHATFGRTDPLAQQSAALTSVLEQGQRSQQAAQSREESLQMLSHDMRAPQASIITLLESESRNIAPYLLSRLTGYARRTLAMADNFVQLARVKETAFAPEEVNLCDLVVEALDELHPIFVARNLRGAGEGLETPAYIEGEPALIIRMLVNVLDNAIKYSPAGGVITAAVIYDGSDVRCSISDRGPGMTPEQLKDIFSRFSAVGKERLPGSVGSGLGLTLVYEAMQRHKGSVSCESDPGVGTRVTLRFPATA